VQHRAALAATGLAAAVGHAASAVVRRAVRHAAAVRLRDAARRARALAVAAVVLAGPAAVGRTGRRALASAADAAPVGAAARGAAITGVDAGAVAAHAAGRALDAGAQVHGAAAADADLIGRAVGHPLARVLRHARQVARLARPARGVAGVQHGALARRARAVLPRRADHAVARLGEAVGDA